MLASQGAVCSPTRTAASRRVPDECAATLVVSLCSSTFHRTVISILVFATLSI